MLQIKKKQENELLLRIKRIKIAKYVIFALCVIGLLLSLIWHNELTRAINPSYYEKSQYELYQDEKIVTDEMLKVHYIDVGCADCTFIELPDNKSVLIDTAGDILDKNKSVEAMMLYLNNNIFNDREKIIDYLILTHADADHISGTTSILEQFSVKNIIRPKVLAKNEKELIKERTEYSFALSYNVDYSDVYSEQIKGIYNYLGKDETSKMYFASSGMNFSTSDYDFEFLTPKLDTYESDNDYSSAVRLSYKSKNFLFMADCTTVGENEILDEYAYDMAKLSSTFLRVGHHGSKTSTSNAFLNAVNADYNIISTRYGVYSNVPSQTVISNIESNNENSKILRTDMCGNVLVKVNSEGEYSVLTCQGSFYFVRHNVYMQWYYVAICIGVICFILIFSIKLKSYEQLVQARRDKINKQKEKMLEEARRLNNNV